MTFYLQITSFVRLDYETTNQPQLGVMVCDRHQRYKLVQDTQRWHRKVPNFVKISSSSREIKNFTSLFVLVVFSIVFKCSSTQLLAQTIELSWILPSSTIKILPRVHLFSSLPPLLQFVLR